LFPGTGEAPPSSFARATEDKSARAGELTSRPTPPRRRKQWLTEKQVRIPEEGSVVGRNNSRFLQCLTPPLASVSITMDKIDREAAGQPERRPRSPQNVCPGRNRLP